MFAVIACTLSLLLILNPSEGSPLVETVYGKVKGLEYTTLNGVETEIFLGIPFAAPPIGDLSLEV